MKKQITDDERWLIKYSLVWMCVYVLFPHGVLLTCQFQRLLMFNLGYFWQKHFGNVAPVRSRASVKGKVVWFYVTDSANMAGSLLQMKVEEQNGWKKHQGNIKTFKNFDSYS